MSYILGVDGGNTKTVAIIVTTEGIICGLGRSGCGDIYGGGSPNVALNHIDEAIEQALAQAGIRSDQLLAGGFSMAGVDWPEDYEFVKEAHLKGGYGKQLLLYNDAIGVRDKFVNKHVGLADVGAKTTQDGLYIWENGYHSLVARGSFLCHERRET